MTQTRPGTREELLDHLVDGRTITIPVTLREVEAFIPLPEYGIDAAEHAELLDDPNLLRIVYTRGHECESGAYDDGAYETIDIEEYAVDLDAVLASDPDQPAWRSISSHATNSQHELRRMHELRGLIAGASALLWRIADPADIDWVDTFPCPCDDCCNRDECTNPPETYEERMEREYREQYPLHEEN